MVSLNAMDGFQAFILAQTYARHCFKQCFHIFMLRIAKKIMAGARFNNLSIMKYYYLIGHICNDTQIMGNYLYRHAQVRPQVS